jgi:putative hydrolase of the HAD superfamily
MRHQGAQAARPSCKGIILRNKHGALRKSWTKMIKAVIFDFDGTLVDFVGTDITCLKVVHQACGATCSTEAFIEIAVEEIMKFHWLVEKGQVDPLDMHQFRLEKTLARYGIPWNQRYLRLYQNKLTGHRATYEGVNDLLSAIKDRGFIIGLVTNAYDGVEQRKRISSSGLESFFDAIVISGEVGYAKPSPDIFHCVLDPLGLNPDQAVFVGDSEKYDIQGANSAGMYSILLSHDDSYKSELADYTYTSIKDLRDHLEGILAKK